MPEISDPRRRIVISVDMANYSRRNNLLQYQAQTDFRSIMDAAAEELAVDRPAWLQQQAGDGELAILPADASERTLVAKMTPTLDTLLRQYNIGRAAESRIRLRVAVHQGLVHLDGANGFPGEAVITVSRLVDAPVVKDALRRRFPRADVALIVSDQLYTDVVCQYHDLRPDLFRRCRRNCRTRDSRKWRGSMFRTRMPRRTPTPGSRRVRTVTPHPRRGRASRGRRRNGTTIG